MEEEVVPQTVGDISKDEQTGDISNDDTVSIAALLQICEGFLQGGVVDAYDPETNFLVPVVPQHYQTVVTKRSCIELCTETGKAWCEIYIHDNHDGFSVALPDLCVCQFDASSEYFLNNFRISDRRFISEAFRPMMESTSAYFRHAHFSEDDHGHREMYWDITPYHTYKVKQANM
jgi:hypothetical protein